MTTPGPYPSLDEILESIGEAGLRMVELNACEGAAGNISVYLGWPVEVQHVFPNEERLVLPIHVPHLADRVLLVTGSGCRLRYLHHDSLATLAAVVINPDGETARVFTVPQKLFTHITSEFNSHLAVHLDQVNHTNTNFQALIHAQPPYLTFLSHIPRYRDEATLNRQLLRWQPETIINLPDGIGVLPFMMPGSQELMQASLESLRAHCIVLWSKHGVLARSDRSAAHAADLIEYAEAAARYEFMNLQSGELADGLSVEEIQRICRSLNLQQTLY